jgi:hypothetical protein
MRPRLTVIVPCFNEESSLPLLHPRLAAVLDGIAADARVLYVDDGSRDGTVALVDAIAVMMTAGASQQEAQFKILVRKATTKPK